MWKRIIIDGEYIEYVDRQVDDIFGLMSNNGHKNHKLGFGNTFFIAKEIMKGIGLYPMEYKIYKDVMVIILVSSASRTLNLIYKANKKN